MSRLLAGIDERRGRGRHRAGRRRSRAGCAAELEGRSRRASSRRRRQRRAARVAPRPVPVGRPGGPGDRESPRLADGRRDDARAGAATSRRSPRECRADGFTDAVLLGMGGSSLGPEVIRRSFGEVPGAAAAAGARLDPSGRRARRAGVDRHRQDDLHRLLEIGRRRSRRSRTTGTSRRWPRPDQFVVVTDPGSPLEQLAATTDCGAASSIRPTSAAATRCCRTSGWCRPR